MDIKEIKTYLQTTADEKRVSNKKIIEALKSAIIKSYNAEFPESQIEVNIDLDRGIFEINRLLKVTENEDEIDEDKEVALSEASKHNHNIKIGDIYREPIKSHQLETHIMRKAMSTFRHELQALSYDEMYKEWKDRVGEVIKAEVESVNQKNGNVVVNLKSTYGILTKMNQIPNEKLRPGKTYNFYIKDVEEHTKGWPVILSRAHPGFVKYLLNINIPEIQERVIEIKDIGRIAGFKTKISVISHRAGVEPVGTIVGVKARRIKAIEEQINNERVEVFEYSDNFPIYLANICSPTPLIGYHIQEPGQYIERREITLIVKPENIALLIGSKGMNVKIISEFLNSEINVQTPEDATNEGIKYIKIDPTQLSKQSVKKTMEKYLSNEDIIKKFKTKTIPNDVFYEYDKKNDNLDKTNKEEKEEITDDSNEEI